MNNNIIIFLCACFFFVFLCFYSFYEFYKEEFVITTIKIEKIENNEEKLNKKENQHPISIELKKPPFIK